MKANCKLQRLINAGITSVHRFPYHRLFITAFGTLLILTLFELMKQHFFPNLTPWASRAISIAFVVCLATAAAYVLLSNSLSWNQSMAGEIAKRQQIERALIKDRSLLRVLMDHIPDPIYFKDSQGRFMRINRAAAMKFGLNDPQQAIGKSDFDFYTSEHAQVAFYDEQQILHTGQAMVAKEECETLPNRPAVWVVTTRLPIRDEMEAVIGTFGISRDITEKKNVEIALQKSEERYRAIIEQSADGIALIDESGLISEWNKAMENLTALCKSEVIRRPLWDIEYQLARDDRKSPALYRRLKESKLKVLSATPVSSHTREVEIQCPDGVHRHVLISDFSVETSDGRLHGSIIRDITARKQAEEKLLYLSTHDTLTGLYNRAYFNDALAQLSRADLYPMSVVMIDIDGMKCVNDTLGHTAGDELLRRTAQVLTRTFRGDDVIARVGGDEFAVLLHRTSGEAAPATVERLKLKLREHNGGYAGELLNLSIGIATALTYGDLAQAIAAADRRMYEDKESHHS